MLEAAQVIEELIDLAKEMREANARGDKLGLSDDEPEPRRKRDNPRAQGWFA